MNRPGQKGFHVKSPKKKEPKKSKKAKDVSNNDIPSYLNISMSNDYYLQGYSCSIDNL